MPRASASREQVSWIVLGELSKGRYHLCAAQHGICRRYLAAQQAVNDLKEVQRRRALAVQSLGQLEDYAGLARSEAKDIEVFLKGPDVGRQ